MKLKSAGRPRVSCFLATTALLLASLSWSKSAMAAPSTTGFSDDDVRSYLAIHLAGCALARSLDDFSDKPSVGSIQDQERRVDAYAACRTALHKVHASSGVLKVNTMLQARACIILGGMGGPAGTYPACN
jgi:hypothetical protein